MAMTENYMFRQNLGQELELVERRLRSIDQVDGHIKPFGVVEARFLLDPRNKEGGTNIIEFWHPEFYLAWLEDEVDDFAVTVVKRSPIGPHLRLTDKNGLKEPISNQDLKAVIWKHRQRIGQSAYLVDSVGDGLDLILADANIGKSLPSDATDPRTFLRVDEYSPVIGSSVVVLNMLADTSMSRDRYDKVAIEIETKSMLKITPIKALS